MQLLPILTDFFLDHTQLTGGMQMSISGKSTNSWHNPRELLGRENNFTGGQPVVGVDLSSQMPVKM